MIAVAQTDSQAIRSPSPVVTAARLHQLLEQIEVATGAACTAEESRRFLLSTCSVTKVASARAIPTAQDQECVRQAAWKHRLETGADRATGADLIPVLEKLGYA